MDFSRCRFCKNSGNSSFLKLIGTLHFLQDLLMIGAGKKTLPFVGWKKYKVQKSIPSLRTTIFYFIPFCHIQGINSVKMRAFL